MITPMNKIVELINVSKTYTVYDHNNQGFAGSITQLLGWGKKRKLLVFKAVNLSIQKGEFIGIIGKNGSGKSTLMNMIAGTILPDKGGIAKRYGSFIRLSLGMGFNPELSARQNVYLNASILGVPLKEIRSKFDEIIAFAELESFKDTQLKFFSSGMRARLAFAVAVLVSTDLLLMDEFFGGVGDESFKKKANEVFQTSLLKDKTVVLVSHNMQTIEKYCDRVLFIHNGTVSSFNDPKAAVAAYREIALPGENSDSWNTEALDA
jgi:ABC-type polysaccharide/polyol phosphate transport system ATPase subunit